MDPTFDYSAKAIALKLGRRPLPVVGMRPRPAAVPSAGPPGQLTPLEQLLLATGFEPLRDFTKFQMVPHPDWNVRLPPDGTYEIGYRGETYIDGTYTAPLEWYEMVRTTGSVLLAFQRGPAGRVDGAEVLEALASGSTLAVGAALTDD
jgi:hypothetical protein